MKCGVVMENKIVKLVALDGETKPDESKKHDLEFNGHTFHLQVTPFKDGSIEALYFTDIEQNFGPFQVPTRRVGDAILVKPRWFDRLLFRTMDKKVLRAVRKMKKNFEQAKLQLERSDKILEAVNNAD